MTIQSMDRSTFPHARALVNRVFPVQTLVERSFFWAWKHRDRRWMQRLLILAGVHSLDDFWVAVDGDGTVVGTTGLHAYARDHEEARWLSWFCVAPEARGRGIGRDLLDFAIRQARERGFRYLRLYTGSDPDEAKAQVLYESRGLREVRRTPKLGFERIDRELELSSVRHA